MWLACTWSTLDEPPCSLVKAREIKLFGHQRSKGRFGKAIFLQKSSPVGKLPWLTEYGLQRVIFGLDVSRVNLDPLSAGEMAHHDALDDLMSTCC